MKLAELLEAVELLRKAGWTVEPPRRRSAKASHGKRIGRPPKNGRRKRGRPLKVKGELK
jgi:hypothetical protein